MNKQLTASSASSASSAVESHTYHALLETPRGKSLFGYWLAVMTVLGGFTPERKPFYKASARSFFASGTVISHHTANGNLENVDAYRVRLTVQGWNYFQGRINGQNKGQEVDKANLRRYTYFLFTGTMPNEEPQQGKAIESMPVRSRKVTLRK